MSSDDEPGPEDDVVGIGAAAALFGLPPSTVRWWEAQAVLPVAPRRGAARRYGERDLRRIGLAYLCCVAGAMPLSRAAVVLSSEAGHDVWQATVTEQVARLTRDIRRLEVARDQLRHVLLCTDDDPADCPYLDGMLAEHTPRGRVTEPDLVAAADRAARMPPPERDDRRPGRHGGAGTPRCPQCTAVLTPTLRGRARTYCSAACRQRAYRRRAAIRP